MTGQLWAPKTHGQLGSRAGGHTDTHTHITEREIGYMYVIYQFSSGKLCGRKPFQGILCTRISTYIHVSFRN